MSVFKKGYIIKGREREELENVLRASVSIQGQFSALLNFIAKREGLDLQHLQFNVDKLAFEPKPKQQAE